MWKLFIVATPPEEIADNHSPAALSDPGSGERKPGLAPWEIELAKDKQEAIWEAEHVTFEIETKFGVAFRAALKAGDFDGIGRFFTDESNITIPTNAVLDPIIHGDLRQWSPRSEELRSSIGPHKLTEWLNNKTRDFEQIQNSKLRVLAIRRSPEQTEIWHTRLLLVLSGTQKGGGHIHLKSEQLVELRIGGESDFSGEGSIVKWQHESLKLQVGLDSLFEEETERLNLQSIGIPDNWTLPLERVAQYRFQTAVADFNLDGLLDIAVSSKDSWVLLSRDSIGEPFRDRGSELGINIEHRNQSRPAWLATWIDYDNDGYPDLLMGNRLYHNLKGKQFVDVTSGSGLRFDVEAMGAQVADYDCDGRLDLYVVMQGGAHENSDKPMPWVNDDNNGASNRLFQNLGQGRFRDVTQSSGAGGGNRHSLAACWFFYDDDRHPDLYIANDFSRNVLLRNRGDGTFEDASNISGTSDYATSMGVAAGDLDNNGTSELYVANMYSKMGRRIIGQVSQSDYPPGIFEQIEGSCAGNRLYRRDKNSSEYDDFGSTLDVDAVGWAYAPAMIDVDNDGWLDLYATCGFLSFDRAKPDG